MGKITLVCGVLVAVLLILGLGSTAVVTEKADPCLTFNPDKCQLSFQPDGNRCAVLIKCGWECDSVVIHYKNKTRNNTLASTWQPGDPEWYTVSVPGAHGSLRTVNNTFIFKHMCNTAMFMSRQYDMWPPRKENIVVFSIAYSLCTVLITAIVCLSIHMLIAIRPRNNAEKEKQP
ncbi:gp19k [Human adenovirus 4a]|uniref:Early E3 18.5 kDa glycoprotein n=2 Tax=Human adenovirus E serotype 4 TaxID=28280 RepID=A0A1U9AL83_ADE04|nr:membrane glycoprotein E3 gp19K [Human adenovirus E4]BBH48894.1 gp19k [Human adenovirus 4a]ANQ44466.1 membrane glycoprotein E3 gp19K [Human adenovirus E4]BBH48940.1 gp19k [Human adenovirus 4a]BBH48986.1 gp19k [Human adenovirus 4a]